MLPETNTCVQHIAPTTKPPYHDHGTCRCLITGQVTLTAPRYTKPGERPSASRARYQAEWVQPRLDFMLEGIKAIRAGKVQA